MTRPPAIDRLELVTRLLRDRPGVTAHALAAELGVSLRTIFRDLDRLRERGYPIDGDRGRGGGLRLHSGWGMPRLLLGRDEALGLLVALAMTEQFALPMFAAPLRQARRKLLGAFSSRERSLLVPLRERVLVGRPASEAVRRSYRDPDPAIGPPLQRAFVDAREITMQYATPDGRSGSRTVEPQALLINAPAWYLLAYDQERAAPRTFRLDRISAVVPGTRTFRPWPRSVSAAACGITTEMP